jgi:hypothetical protein
LDSLLGDVSGQPGDLIRSGCAAAFFNVPWILSQSDRIQTRDVSNGCCFIRECGAIEFVKSNDRAMSQETLESFQPRIDDFTKPSDATRRYRLFTDFG